jgi:hypothetical protein
MMRKDLVDNSLTNRSQTNTNGSTNTEPGTVADGRSKHIKEGEGGSGNEGNSEDFLGIGLLLGNEVCSQCNHGAFKNVFNNPDDDFFTVN